jgi:hypothetical protein
MQRAFVQPMVSAHSNLDIIKIACNQITTPL